MPVEVVRPSPFSSWSVASISTSRLMVSTGAPFSRVTSERAPDSPAFCACKVRVTVSGLYWKTTTLANGLKMSKPTIAPLMTRGLPGNGLIVRPLILPASRRRRSLTGARSRLGLLGYLRVGAERLVFQRGLVELLLRAPFDALQERLEVGLVQLVQLRRGLLEVLVFEALLGRPNLYLLVDILRVRRDVLNRLVRESLAVHPRDCGGRGLLTLP